MSGLRIVKNISMILVVAVAVSLAGCADGDMATVRINVNLPENARFAQRPSLFDRVISFITISKPAYAEKAPEYLNIYSIKLNVSGPGMNSETMDIPADTGYIAVDIPTGQSRKFTVEVYLDYGESIEKEIGGIKIIDLVPGTIDLKINLGELPNAPYISGMSLGDVGVILEWEDYNEGEILGFNVYRAPGAEDELEPQASFRQILSRELSFFPYEVFYSYTDLSGNLYTWYCISTYNQYGESELSYYDRLQNYW